MCKVLIIITEITASKISRPTYKNKRIAFRERNQDNLELSHQVFWEQQLTTIDAGQMASRLRKRLDVEAYFARSGRTLRKGRFRLWFNEDVKPKLLRAGFAAVGLYERGVRNALAVQVRTVDFRFGDLPPAFDGFTILQVSDLHIDKVDGLAEAVAGIVEPLRPDLCVLTGDYRYEIRGSCAEVYPRMSKVLRAIHARLGTYGILGNHDAAEIAYWLSEQGVRMLINQAVPIQRGDSAVWLLGTDDPHDYRCDDLPAALKDVPADAFKILLTHTPALYAEAAAAGIQLYACGHTHAGQIRLPYVGAVKKNGQFPRSFTQGPWVYHGMHAYTSWGAGCSTLPVRFCCPPEVTLLRLQCAR